MVVEFEGVHLVGNNLLLLFDAFNIALCLQHVHLVQCILQCTAILLNILVSAKFGALRLKLCDPVLYPLHDLVELLSTSMGFFQKLSRLCLSLVVNPGSSHFLQ